VPREIVDHYQELTAEIEHLTSQERDLSLSYPPIDPSVQAVYRQRVRRWQEKGDLERQFPSLGRSGASRGRVDFVKVFNPPDKPISGELTVAEDNAWAVSCTTTQTFRLFEVPKPGVEQCTVLYRATCQTPFFLKAGERPDLIRLNLVIEGRGKVLIKDIELTASPSR
jgi:hypothetical protein